MSRRLIFFVLFVSCFFIFCGHAQNYNDYLNAARRHIEKGNYEKAEASYSVYKQLTGKTDAKLESIFFSHSKNPYGVFASKDSIIEFISEYYNSIVKGNYISYFENNNINFFDLVQVDRHAVAKRLDKANKNVKWDYDWTTLNISKLSSGSIKAVYSFDYYIYYKSRTDRYRITSEMIITTNKKICSIKDIETHKIP